MRVIETNILPPGAAALTLFPIGILVKPGRMTDSLRVHEEEHWKDQRVWCLYGLGVGLLVWFLLYLLVLPFGWNPLRAHAERKAFRAQGYTDEEIDRKLRLAPYYLMWGR